ncbi:MAG TPA: cytochrome P450, partial [Ktedonobacteraceae bacterium]|nr:cytochrome P450 [Ktedonobacteraceae bacterium]
TGYETTANLIGNGVLALLTHPDQMELLKNNPDPALLKTAVEEFLRYHSPVTISTFRWVREDIWLGEKLIQRGDGVVISLSAANRDETTFTGADALDVTRRENAHLAFGKGIHYCLGAPLARLEGQIAIGTLLRRLPKLQLQVDPATLSWRPGSTVMGLYHLPVVF